MLEKSTFSAASTSPPEWLGALRLPEPLALVASAPEPIREAAK